MTHIERLYPYVFSLMMVVLAALSIFSIIRNDWADLFVILQAAAIICVPTLLEKKFAIHTPYFLRIGFLLFMFSTLVLGEIADLYNTFWWWDVILHVVSSAGITIIGFILITVIYRDRDLKAAPWLSSFLVFSFAMSLAVLWEAYEFIIDLLIEVDTPMQLGNTDTMTDLLVAILGSLLVCFYGYVYLKRKATHSIVAATIEEGKINNL